MLEDSQFSSRQVRTPLDTMMHLLPDAGQVIGEERLRNWHAMVFFALAFCEPWFSKFERSFSFFLATLHGFVRICFTPKDLFQNVSVTFLLQEMEDGNAIVLQNEIVEADGSTHAILKNCITIIMYSPIRIVRDSLLAQGKERSAAQRL